MNKLKKFENFGDVYKLVEKTIEEENIELITSKQMVMNIVLSSAQKIIHSLDDNDFSLKEKTEFVTFLLPKILMRQ